MRDHWTARAAVTNVLHALRVYVCRRVCMYGIRRLWFWCCPGIVLRFVSKKKRTFRERVLSPDVDPSFLSPIPACFIPRLRCILEIHPTSPILTLWLGLHQPLPRFFFSHPWPQIVLCVCVCIFCFRCRMRSRPAYSWSGLLRRSRCVCQAVLGGQVLELQRNTIMGGHIK